MPAIGARTGVHPLPGVPGTRTVPGTGVRMPPVIPKSNFVNPDARITCLTPGCWGDLVLFPTGEVDHDGIPGFANATLCPLCMTGFDLDPDISDRDLYLQVSWLRANPGEALPDEVPAPGDNT